MMVNTYADGSVAQGLAILSVGAILCLVARDVSLADVPSKVVPVCKVPIEIVSHTGLRHLGCAQDVAACTHPTLSPGDRIDTKHCKVTSYGMASTTKLLVGLPLDINSVHADALTQLSGIGDSLAQAVVAYRKNHGAFSNLDELTHVRGIGEKKLASLKPFLAVLPQERATTTDAQ